MIFLIEVMLNIIIKFTFKYSKEEEIIIYCRQNIGLSIRDIGMVLHTLFDKDNEINNRIIKYSKNSIHKCIKRHYYTVYSK